MTADSAVTLDVSSDLHVDEAEIPNNKLALVFTNRGSIGLKVRICVALRCGTGEGALLPSPDSMPDARLDTGGALTRMNPGTRPMDGARKPGWPDFQMWQTRSTGIDLAPGAALTITYSRVPATTRPGAAAIAALVEVKPAAGGGWEAGELRHQTVNISARLDPQQPRVHYFQADRDLVVHGGRERVRIRFLTSGFDGLVVKRNNRELAIDIERKDDGTTLGSVEDLPAISSTYRLEAHAGGLASPSVVRTVTVQVVAPGWNQLPLRQARPLQIVRPEVLGRHGTGSLFGMFLSETGRGEIHTGQMGLDDWAATGLIVPDDMTTSPAIHWRSRLWLIGGSAVDYNRASARVVSLPDIATDDTPREWTESHPIPEFPIGHGQGGARSARAGHAAVIVPVRVRDRVENQLWVLGGFRNGRYFNDVLRLNEDGSWSELSPGIDDPGDARWDSRRGHSVVVRLPSHDLHAPAEVWLYGGNRRGTDFEDFWKTTDGCTWQRMTGPEMRPSPGKPRGATLVAVPGETGDRLVLLGTFRRRLDGGDGLGNITFSGMYEWQDGNEVWHESEIGRGWDTFLGGHFSMRAVAFNEMLFVWSLHAGYREGQAGRLNVLV